ncbi:J domain-containing protein [Heracleum sosnowskyi]|uniref:J domain-containing protein n=1 Tax=Heracleum sosnowskyi TaxID=360622 RepID=A0AAD8M621_9APIA|nr:J domain-containing protein [Heracleum sosnowskyi]
MASASLLTSQSLISPLSPSFKLSGENTQLPATNLRFSQPRVISSATSSAEKTRSYNNNTVHSANASLSLYQILGIPMGATVVEIKSAYRKLARTCHPDVATVKSSAVDEFIKIKAAYSTLSDPEKRADYDRMIFRRHRSVLSSQEPVYSRFRSSGYTGRNWESDQCW